MSQTKTAKKKTLDLDAIQDMADKAGMTASELLEWGLYALLSTYGEDNGYARRAAEELNDLREREGMIPDQLVPSSPLAEFADEAGISFRELSELALLTAFDTLKCTDFPNKQPRELLEDDRRTKGPLLPHFQHDRVKVHPMMAALFSGDLRAVHGATFGDISSKDVKLEHLFIRDSLRSAFGLDSWEDTMAQLAAIEPAIRHCPTLKNEAAAIRALIEAESVLNDFCLAVEHS